MEKSTVAAAPMVWWLPETYSRVREICVDQDDTPETFDEWRKRAQKLFDELSAQGYPVVKVVVDPDELLNWCIAEGREVDSTARATFAVIIYERDNRQRH